MKTRARSAHLEVKTPAVDIKIFSVARPYYICFSKLRETLGLSWNRFLFLWENDVIPEADAEVGDKPIWLMSSVDKVKSAIAAYEALQVAARHNSAISIQ